MIAANSSWGGTVMMESQPSRLKPVEGGRPSRTPSRYADEPQDGAQREQPAIIESVVDRPPRRKLSDERSIRHRFPIGGHEGYITVGMYEDGPPGEIFITMA